MMLPKEYQNIEDMFLEIDDLDLEFYFDDYHHDFEEMEK
jgi:hypothetical protein